MSNPRTSTLNPNAAEYIPLFMRGGGAGDNASVNDPNTGNQYGRGYGGEQVVEHGAMSSQGYQGSGSSVPPMRKLNYDDCLEDIDLEYLQMLFPGISDGSLVGVLLANDGDLDASIEMLNHLESDVMEPSENLPDTLDIGDVPDSDSKYEPAQPKLKNVAGESSTSTPSPAGPSSVA